MTSQTLPIDERLPTLLASLRDGASRIVLEAPPGAGKTTRVPPALLAEAWCAGKVLVSEPRRIAARLAATRVAQERGGRLGDEVGYQVRFDDKTSPKTRLIYLTEGLLLRRLLQGELNSVSAVVLDEVHERSADLDQILALVLGIQKKNPALRLILMSATLNAEELKNYLTDPDFGAPVCIRSEGKSFEVSLEYQGKEDERPLAIQVRSAVRSSLERPGDMLVFLPGGREIRDCEASLSAIQGITAIPLHGDLSVEQQARAVSGAKGERRVVLSTNVAESSLTIPGVTTVIDSGLARSAEFDAWSSVMRLETRKISQARCVQRSGRAGRVANGHCIRLFTAGDFASRASQDKPEILRCDLSDATLRLLHADLGGVHPRALPWLTAPSSEAWEQAEQLLEQLGAIAGGKLTEVGQAMALLPLPPRLGRILVEASRCDILEWAARATALLVERDIVITRPGGRGNAPDVVFGDSDLDDRLDRLEQLEEDRFDRRTAQDLRLDIRSAEQVIRAARSNAAAAMKACRHLSPSSISQDSDDNALRTKVLLHGFPDRVGTRRGTSRDVVLANGLQASLDENSCVAHAPLMVALSSDAPFGRQRKPLIRIACRVEPDWLLDFAGDQIEASEEYVWDSQKERVDALSRLSYGKVVLDETRGQATPHPEAGKVLAQAALLKGPAVFDPEGTLEDLSVRLELLVNLAPDLLSRHSEEEALRVRSWCATPESLALEALRSASESRVNLKGLKEANLALELYSTLSSELQSALRTSTPSHATLSGGHRVPIHYERGRSAWIESRLQDFFSMTSTPSICQGRVPLQLHLLAPNKRAVQVTTDLEGFWERHYPEQRKQLMRRYPRHLWPEDGRTAQPPTPGKIR